MEGICIPENLAEEKAGSVEEYVNVAKNLRETDGANHNCTQAILVTFAEEMGMTAQVARGLGANFGLGMGCGSACGVVTGVVAALGAMGFDKKTTATFMKSFLEKYGSYDCKVLLQTCKERGESRAEHCNRLIFHGVEEVGKILEAKEDVRELSGEK